jgi:cytochrome c556
MKIRSLLLSAMMLLGGTGIAQTMTPDEAVKYRQDVMENLKDAMKKLKSADAQSATAAATKIHKLTQNLTKLFPPGSTNSDSEASAEIWNRWAEFEQVANEAGAKAEVLVKAAGSGDANALENAIREMGSACKSCHKDFRSEK